MERGIELDLVDDAVLQGEQSHQNLAVGRHGAFRGMWPNTDKRNGSSRGPGSCGIGTFHI
jgi:hypothetical protein